MEMEFRFAGFSRNKVSFNLLRWQRESYKLRDIVSKISLVLLQIGRSFCETSSNIGYVFLRHIGTVFCLNLRMSSVNTLLHSWCYLHYINLMPTLSLAKINRIASNRVTALYKQYHCFKTFPV